jgi:hypothetical protein
MRHHAKAVFVGEVLEVRESKQTDEVTPYAVRFRVERYWKGVETNEITVHTDLHGCGPNLEVGNEYLVYAMSKQLETGCTRTRKIEFRR